MEMRGLAAYQEQRENSDVRYTPQRVMDIDGHHVAWVRYEGANVIDGRDNVFSGYSMMCECSFEGHASEHGYWVSTGDDHRCVYAEAARLIRAREVADEINKTLPGHETLDSLSWKRDADERIGTLLVDLLARARAGEWLGQRDESLYLQTVEQISGIPLRRLHKVADALMRKRQLALSGNILAEWDESYAPRDDDDSHLDDGAPPTGERIECELQLHSETGTEGGYWACMDRAHVSWKTPPYGVWPGQAAKLAADESLVEVIATARADGSPVEDGVRAGEVLQATVKLADGSERLVSSDALLVEQHSYEGLHLLKTGDWLEILDPRDETRVLWQGYVRLRHYPSFTEDAAGMWIHADQRGVAREQWAAWFLKNHPARLIPAT